MTDTITALGVECVREDTGCEHRVWHAGRWLAPLDPAPLVVTRLHSPEEWLIELERGTTKVRATGPTLAAAEADAREQLAATARLIAALGVEVAAVPREAWQRRRGEAVERLVDEYESVCGPARFRATLAGCLADAWDDGAAASEGAEALGVFALCAALDHAARAAAESDEDSHEVRLDSDGIVEIIVYRRAGSASARICAEDIDGRDLAELSESTIARLVRAAGEAAPW